MSRFGQIRRLKTRGRPTRFYYVRIYDAADRSERWVSTKCSSVAAAREWVKTQEFQHALGPERLEKQKSAELTFRQAYLDWLAEQKQRASEGRYLNLELRGDRFWLGYFAGKRLRGIHREDIVQYLGKRKLGSILHPDTRRRQRVTRPASATLNGDIRDLRTFFKFCLFNQWIDRSPMHGIKNFAGEMRRRVRTITSEEEDRLVGACRASYVVTLEAKRNKGGRRGGKVSSEKSRFQQTVPAKSYLTPLVLVALNCGFRKRTLLSLRWGDIDLDAAHWEIPGEFFKTGQDYIAPVPQVVVKELREYRRLIAEECEKLRVPPIERLGKNASIFGLTPKSNFLVAFKAAARRAGLDDMTFHDCRRIYLNKLRERGVNLEVAMALTGHKSVTTVMKYYREVPQKDLVTAVAAIDEGQSKNQNIVTGTASPGIGD